VEHDRLLFSFSGSTALRAGGISVSAASVFLSTETFADRFARPKPSVAGLTNFQAVARHRMLCQQVQSYSRLQILTGK
jgi:hypothetical protein